MRNKYGFKLSVPLILVVAWLSKIEVLPDKIYLSQSPIKMSRNHQKPYSNITLFFTKSTVSYFPGIKPHLIDTEQDLQAHGKPH
jgi:hypothetical protein